MPDPTEPRRGPDAPLRRRMLALGATAVLTAVGIAGPAIAADRTTPPRAPVDVARKRVDTAIPTFTHPTRITNPLFPITATRHMVALGSEGDVALRQETTLLDRTRKIRVRGQDVEVVVSQFVAHGDGELLETAIDYFAQADDGSVWYFGEDVTNYEGGRVQNHDGTWLAGRDGPPGMIMPAHPAVGDVYRPENIPGLVFEETTVTATGLTVAGPSGPIHGAIRVEEHPMGGDVETKVFAPGYGEFEATVPASAEHVLAAVAVPTDVIGGPEPAALDSLSDTAHDLLRRAPTSRWSRLRSLVADAHHSWDRLSASPLPPVLADQMGNAVEGLDAAVASGSRAELAQSALDVELAGLDLELRHTDREEVDRDRIGSWHTQLRLHHAAGDASAVASDRLIIRSIEDRLDD